MRVTRLGVLGTLLALGSRLPLASLLLWGILVTGIIFLSLLQGSQGQGLGLSDDLLLSRLRSLGADSLALATGGIYDLLLHQVAPVNLVLGTLSLAWVWVFSCNFFIVGFPLAALDADWEGHVPRLVFKANALALHLLLPGILHRGVVL
ncbi:hypothetical protein B0J15DRAFT_3382 [Fusarium solani]|jgi:hypothetical protein|uniref:Uncharacterized protein n=1 Tax=Fusarium solani TaxID=169388 RepID=A0A9P9L596_FUSSL|nr:uncharacterized protein B0J15DRAFT_3382 [Fusarium solani]KAH7275070.1 hypothetical protein B0J15DRAFT_3382 [Fusarium solani]